MLRLKVLTFDVNNTLMRVRNSVGQQYARVASQFSVDVNPDEVSKAYRVLYKEQAQQHPNFGTETGITTKQWWSQVVHKTFQEVGYHDENTLVKISSKLFDDFKHASSWEVFPEVKEMLTFFNKNGICLGVISNTDERLISILQETDLAQHFAFVLPSVYAKCRKPDPQIFQQVLDRLQIPAQDCAHIGDSLEKDYYGAKAVGMNAFLVDRNQTLIETHNEIPKDRLLQDLTQLENKVFLDHVS